MQLIQRLGNGNNTAYATGEYSYENYVEDYIRLIENNPGSCDTVWINTLYGFPKLETHRAHANELKRLSLRFREKGINVALQVSNTIGHGEYMRSRDNTGLVYDGSPVRNLVGPDGTKAKYCFCWNDKVFRKYTLENIAYYAELQPSCVWVDDDFRPNNHAPVEYGCFCDDCIAKFNRENGTEFTREALVEAILHGEIKWREKWIAFVRAGLYSLMYEISKTVLAVSPESEMGYQYCANGAYSGYGFDYVFQAMKDATGKAPRSRPGGGAYNDIDANDFLIKNIFIAWTNTMLPDYVTNKTPENECLPFVAHAKTPTGTAFESSLYLAYGNTDMSYSDMMSVNEPLEWYNSLFAELAANRPYWERLSAYSNGETHQSGLHYFMSGALWKKKLTNEQGFAALNHENWLSLQFLFRVGLPISYDKQDQSVVLLHPDTAKNLTEAEIAYLLTKRVITDGETVKILGLEKELGIGVEPFMGETAPPVRARYLDHPTRPDGLRSWAYSGMTRGSNDKYRLIVTPEAETLAVYENTTTGKLLEDTVREYAADAIVNTKHGGKWAVLGYSPWKWVISTLVRDRFYNLADYLGEKKLAARCKTYTPNMLMPRQNGAGKTVCVSLANLSMEKCEKAVLTVRNPETENFRFMKQREKTETPLAFQKVGEDYLVELPLIEGWTVGTVFCGKK